MSLKFLLFVLLTVPVIFCGACRKVPPIRNAGAKTPGDNNYRILIGEDPQGYEPGRTYNLFLLGSRTHTKVQQFSHFMLIARSASTSDPKTASYRGVSPIASGRFQLFGDSLATFNKECVNTVSEADDFPKTEIQVMWVAPPKGSGCIALSAMVFEGRNSWYSDDGALTKIICEAKPTKESIKSECCACDEAKYQMVFEGIWSNETHPRDFPFAAWLTHFSDIIGGSHESNFSFWGENHIASDGFKSLAEWGSARLLETELRAKGSKLRSLIKAPGLWYPSVNTNTSAQFRVDRKHPKISVVSMFGPSPDWVVGVSGLNLCEEDCSWKDGLEIDLYPWDAGTDSGITYMSANQETQPRERMRKITPMYPEDPRAPFYNPGQPEVPPMARLYLKKERNIPKGCDEEVLQAQLDTLEESEDDTKAECQTTDYTSWSPCSVTCGKGLRMRSRDYVNAQRAKESNCNRQLIFKEMCVAAIAECESSSDQDEDSEDISRLTATVDEGGEGVGVCKTSRWSAWSECSASCGIGISMRTRTFLDNMGRKKCPHIIVVEKQKCMQPECSATDIAGPDAMCPTTVWSDWSPCSSTCGKGVRIRTRLFTGEPSNKQECERRITMNEQRECEDRPDCFFSGDDAQEICQEKVDVGPCRGSFMRFAFNAVTGQCEGFSYGGCRGNRNNFVNRDDCLKTCQSPARLQQVSPRAAIQEDEEEQDSAAPKVDCRMSEWTTWSPCSGSCDYGQSSKHREILRQPENGGQPCGPSIRRRRCYLQKC